MRQDDQPVFMIGVAAELCGVHPQTLRQYERLGLVVPKRIGAKNRLYSEADIRRVRQVQRLTQQLGVNLAGVDVILKLLEDIESMRREWEVQMRQYIEEAEERMRNIMQNPTTPIRRDENLLPVPNFSFRRTIDL